MLPVQHESTRLYLVPDKQQGLSVFLWQTLTHILIDFIALSNIKTLGKLVCRRASSHPLAQTRQLCRPPWPPRQPPPASREVRDVRTLDADPPQVRLIARPCHPPTASSAAPEPSSVGQVAAHARRPSPASPQGETASREFGRATTPGENILLSPPSCSPRCPQPGQCPEPSAAADTARTRHGPDTEPPLHPPPPRPGMQHSRRLPSPAAYPGSPSCAACGAAPCRPTRSPRG